MILFCRIIFLTCGFGGLLTQRRRRRSRRRRIKLRKVIRFGLDEKCPFEGFNFCLGFYGESITNER
jgi:hypothetical protein